MNHPKKYLSATELAKLGGCEKQLLLKKRWGDRITAAQQRRMDQGTAAHEAYYRKIGKKKDQRCFIATAVYGANADETQQLRAFRDRALLPYWFGRVFIKFYYYYSPHISLMIRRIPWLKHWIRQILDKIVRYL